MAHMSHVVECEAEERDNPKKCSALSVQYMTAL